MIPVGMFRRDVVTGEKPRLLMMMPLNVVRPELSAGQNVLGTRCIPPLGILIAMLKRKRVQVLGSITASKA